MFVFLLLDLHSASKAFAFREQPVIVFSPVLLGFKVSFACVQVAHEESTITSLVHVRCYVHFSTCMLSKEGKFAVEHTLGLTPCLERGQLLVMLVQCVTKVL